MPPLLSVLLTASLGGPTEGGDIYAAGPAPTALRGHAAAMLAHVLNTHGAAYPSLRPRVARTLLRALLVGTGEGEEQGGEQSAGTGAQAAPTASTGTKLGALVGLHRMGAGAIRTLLRGDHNSARASNEANGTERKTPPLAQLGAWMERWERAGGDREIDPLVNEVRVSIERAICQTLIPAAPFDDA